MTEQEKRELAEREARAAALPKVETRTVAASHVEVRSAASDDPNAIIVEGYAALFADGFGSEPGYDMGFARETVRRGAFAKTLSEAPDVRFLVDHTGLPLARTKSGTLSLREDDKGLWFEARLDGTDPDVQSLVPKMRRGDMDGASFAFRTIRDNWDARFENRELVEVSLDNGDVSVVGLPAYKATKVGLRSDDDDVILAALQEMRAGKALSSKNESLVKAAFEALSKLVKSVGIALDPDPDAGKEPVKVEADASADGETVSSKRSASHFRAELEMLASRGKGHTRH